MTFAPNMETRRRSRYWAVFVITALAIQFLIFLALRRPFLDIFRHSVAESPGASSPAASFPDAIVAITIVIEGDDPTPEQQAEKSTLYSSTDAEFPDRTDRQATGQGTSRIANIDILDITGEAQTPIPSEPSGRDAAMPPRPVEITWPETKDLGHCLGLQINIDIRVSENGEVIEVSAVERDLPGDCIAAALDAARRIKFTPGLVKGKPVEMSTRLRIDFRRKR